MIEVPTTEFPRSGALPTIRLRALPTSLNEAASIAVAYADDVCREQPSAIDRHAVAVAGMHSLLHTGIGELAVLDLRAVMSGESSASEHLRTELSRLQ